MGFATVGYGVAVMTKVVMMVIRRRGGRVVKAVYGGRRETVRVGRETVRVGRVVIGDGQWGGRLIDLRLCRVLLIV